MRAQRELEATPGCAREPPPVAVLALRAPQVGPCPYYHDAQTVQSRGRKAVTLVAVWVRKNSTLTELVMAGDSRLSGFGSWDGCPKVVTLPRPATAIAMSGDATEAYAFMLMAQTQALLHDGATTGRMDIGGFSDRLTKGFQVARDGISGRDGVPDDPDLDVVLGGWSFRRTRMEAFSFRLDSEGRVRKHDLTPGLHESLRPHVYFAGDAAPQARRMLIRLTKERNLPFAIAKGPTLDVEQMAARGWDSDSFYLDWEPLEILLSLIDAPDAHTVGGKPQVCRIYQYGVAEHFVWLDGTGAYFGGRKILSDERFDRRTLSWQDGIAVVGQPDLSMR